MKNLQEQLELLKEDRDVVEPFARRLLQRIQARFPDADVRMEDIGFALELRFLNPAAQVHRLLVDLMKESEDVGF